MQEGLFFNQATIHHFRHRLAITFSCESLTCNAFFYQIVHHALRSSLRKIHVVGVTSTIIGVGSQFNGDVRIVGEQFAIFPRQGQTLARPLPCQMDKTHCAQAQGCSSKEEGIAKHIDAPH